MALTKQDKELLEWLFQEENKVEFIENFIKIADKNGILVPFVLTEQQKDFVNGMVDKNVVLKSRQLGLSVVSLALMLRLAIIYPYTNSKIFSFEQDSATDNFNKLKVMYDNLPEFIKNNIGTDANNREVLKFTNGSTITCKTVGKSANGKGKGATINGILHLTEFAYYQNSHSQLVSLSSAVSSSGTIIIESTANGSGNYFHKHYIEAKKNENGYKSFFFNWINARELFIDDYEKAVIKYKNMNERDLRKEDLDGEEKELIKMGATLDQLTYRRFEIAIKGLDKFHQERPSTDNEAFLTTGESIFNTKLIDSKEKEIIINGDKFIDKRKLDKLPKLLDKYYGKEFKIYEDVKVGMRYYIGVDSGDGCGGDSSVIEVFNTLGVECAMFKSNKIKPYVFAEILNEVGRYFNKGYLLIERNHRSGDTIIGKMREVYKYQRLYKHIAYDERNNPQAKWGFDTNAKTKGLILNNFVEMFETAQIQVNSKEVLEEMKTFVSKDGSCNAMSGFHDDTIIATALALEGLRAGKWIRWIN